MLYSFLNHIWLSAPKNMLTQVSHDVSVNITVLTGYSMLYPEKHPLISENSLPNSPSEAACFPDRSSFMLHSARR